MRKEYTLDMSEFTITVKVPKQVIWRAKLSILIMRFGAWVGGFGGFVAEDGDE